MLNDENFYSPKSSCAVDKFAFDHEATVKYNTDMAKLDQFTICAWARFTKHDGDHVIFTYSGEFIHVYLHSYKSLVRTFLCHVHCCSLHKIINYLNNQTKIKPDGLKDHFCCFHFLCFFASSLFNLLHNFSPCDRTGAAIA